VKVLLLGGGGREHAIGWKLAQSPLLTNLTSAPGNPGLAELGETVDLDPNDGEAVLAEARRTDLVVVGPESPLEAGVTDTLHRSGIPVFGPSKAGARLETSKTFAKEVMYRADVPTGRWETLTDATSALLHLDSIQPPYVVKADGLAAGKGVLVTEDLEAARKWATDCFTGRFGAAGRQVIIEEHLDGEEISVFGLCDGSDVIGFRTARDYKRLGDGNSGPNTGGMGSYTPVPGHGDSFVAEVLDTVIRPVLGVLAEAGAPYVGFIYAGLVLTADGPRVLEFNCRLGDPEAQALLPTLDSDLLAAIVSCVEGTAHHVGFEWSGESAVNVVLAAKGYPEAPVRGDEITGLGAGNGHTLVFHAGTTEQAGRIVTAGGRVLSVVGLGPDLDMARDRAYERAAEIRFAGKQYRTDIAQ
jgi:phosphoribosylamine--glycine ligase